MARRYLCHRMVGVPGDQHPGIPDVQPGTTDHQPLDLSGDLLGSRRRVLHHAPATKAPAKRRRFRLSVFSLVLVILVVWQWGNAGWILVKAQLAQWLIAQAWENSASPNQAIKPWPWADTHPVARLRLPEEGVDLFVLEGAQGNSLAFGPGHLQGTALPGEGISVIGGHRDTHFRFLKDIQPGDALYVQTRDGRELTYRIEQSQIVDSRHTPLQLPDYPASGLVLVTCYPFDALDPNGPLRLVVWASEVNDAELMPTQQPYPQQITERGSLSFSL